MSTVQTVRGPVDTAELGRTLMHEQVQNQGAAWWDEDERVRERGVTEAQLDQMLVDNPRRYFS